MDGSELQIGKLKQIIGIAENGNRYIGVGKLKKIIGDGI